MRYFPHTPEDIDEMLKAVGVDSIEDLFDTIPADCRRKSDMSLPDPLSEWDLNHHIDELCAGMAVSPEYKVFMGAGSYEHYIPAACQHLAGRSEFVTSYTPYQPEMSQGTLQAIFEYQTLTSRLLGMEVANASQYDGASALAEAALMAVRITRRKKVAVSRLVHPHYRRVLATYLAPTDYEILELPYLPDGTTDLSALDNMAELAAVVVQSPNFFGCLENLKTIGDMTSSEKTLLVVKNGLENKRLQDENRTLKSQLESQYQIIGHSVQHLLIFLQQAVVDSHAPDLMFPRHDHTHQTST